MNENTLLPLKVLVEKAVRPVRASLGRKRKMREELLAHLSSVFEEETKRDEESSALERTTRRFGDPAELARQLQAAVPTSDAPARLIEAYVGLPHCESVLRRALRYAGLVAAFCFTALLVMVLLAGHGRTWFDLAGVPSLLAPIFMALLVFCATLIEEGMRHALFGSRGRNWLRVIAFGLAAWLLVPGLSLLWSFALTGAFLANLLDLWPLFLSGALGPLALIIIVYAVTPEIRYLEEWANLKIQ